MSFRFGDKAKGEPLVVNSIVKLCDVCAKEWDAQALYAEQIGRKTKAASA
jgi:hypothetical protein